MRLGNANRLRFRRIFVGFPPLLGTETGSESTRSYERDPVRIRR